MPERVVGALRSIAAGCPKGTVMWSPARFVARGISGCEQLIGLGNVARTCRGGLAAFGRGCVKTREGRNVAADMTMPSNHCYKKSHGVDPLKKEFELGSHPSRHLRPSTRSGVSGCGFDARTDQWSATRPSVRRLTVR